MYKALKKYIKKELVYEYYQEFMITKLYVDKKCTKEGAFEAF